MRRRAVLAACAASIAGAAAAQPSAAPGSGLLFIGNSLTYWNDLPLLVQAMFDGAGGERFEIASVVQPGFGLQDHWARRDARREIARGGWRTVILQQGPSSRPESRRQLRGDVARFSERIREVGARPALYSVWPARENERDFERAIESYALAASDVGGLLFPAAAAWRAAWAREPRLPLYSDDGLHPTSIGSYLAALTMFVVLSGRGARLAPSTLELRDGRSVPFPPAITAILQDAADEAVAATAQAPNESAPAP